MPEEKFVVSENDGKRVTRRSNGRKRVVTVNESDSRTVQSDVENAEIKSLLAKYEAGILPQLQQSDLQYRDITSFTDYHEAMQHAEGVRQEFMALDPRIRRVFENDHLVWLDAAKDGLDPEQINGLTKLGLIEAPEPPAPEPVVAEPPTTE